jgi:hypothetical protein
MTLILSMGSRDYLIHACDRRVTAGKRVHDDDATKMCNLVFRDGNAIVSYTGLAISGRFSMRKWLRENLAQSGKPDFGLDGIIKRFTDRATKHFRTCADICAVQPASRRTTFIFSGYVYYRDDLPARGVLVEVSNCDNGRLAEPTDDFVATALLEPLPDGDRQRDRESVPRLRETSVAEIVSFRSGDRPYGRRASMDSSSPRPVLPISSFRGQ